MLPMLPTAMPEYTTTSSSSSSSSSCCCCCCCCNNSSSSSSSSIGSFDCQFILLLLTYWL